MSSRFVTLEFLFIILILPHLLAAEPLDSTQTATKTVGAAIPAEYLSSITNLMEDKWPKNRTINIVCHGHSVPSGYFKTPVVNTFNAYPHLLHQELKKRYPHAVINVIVTAIGGENSINGSKRFERDVLPHRPDILLIDYGLNDRGAGLKKAEAAWSSMITKAKQEGIKVLLLTPTADKRAKMEDPNDSLNQHAEQIRTLANNHQVALVDSYQAFKSHIKNDGSLEDIMSQVNHPNRNGHDLVVRELIKWFPSSK